MIIVTTENSTVFVNEREYRNISHIKDQKMVVAYRAHPRSDNALISGKPECIEDVVLVHYFSDSEPVKFSDNGNEINNLREKCQELDEINTDYRNEIMILRTKLELTEEKLAKYESGTD